MRFAGDEGVGVRGRVIAERPRVSVEAEKRENHRIVG